MNTLKMTSLEQRAILTLSSVMALRMIGLFMVLPVFALYAETLPGATPTLIGLGLGIYGLFQALFQIPFGALSDRLGRKRMIGIGLSIFILGSVIAGFAPSMAIMILGRALQGIGAVGSTILALMADLTREEQRSKAMAIAGITIGFSFSLAMLLGPILIKWLPINNLFFLAALSGIIALFILYAATPNPAITRWHSDTEPQRRAFLQLLIAPELLKLNSGIFILHAIFTASFIIIPITLSQYVQLAAHNQWWLYLPTLLIALVISLFCIGLAERKKHLKPYFLGSILTLALAELLLWLTPHGKLFAASGLCLFFTGFSILEAFMPSLISRTAPASRKGSALGIYSCAQFFGIFVGGVLGGWLYGLFSFTGVYLFCILLALCWLLLACFMQPPRYLKTEIWRILPEQQSTWERILPNLRLIPGMIEATFSKEDNVAYLKMEPGSVKHPDFIRLKEQLQSK